MKNFKRDFKGGGSRGGRGGSPTWKGNTGAAGRTESFKATCGDCGKDCTVPFKPSGRKPVLCSMCFRDSDHPSSNKGYNKDKSQFNRSSGRPAFDKPRFNRSSDRPSSDKPSYQSIEQAPRQKIGPSLKEEIKSINDKMDKILKLLSKSETGEKEDNFNFKN